jgi:hypothetical protein
LEAFETDLNLGSPVGWFWKREYITEVGYRYYLFVFFDGQKTLYDPMNIQLSMAAIGSRLPETKVHTLFLLFQKWSISIVELNCRAKVIAIV